MPRFNWPLDGEVEQVEDSCDNLLSCLSAFEECRESDFLVSGTSSDYAPSEDYISDSDRNEKRNPHRIRRKVRKSSSKHGMRQQVIDDRLKQRTDDIISALRVSCTSVVSAFQVQRKLLYELHGLGVRIPDLFPDDAVLRRRVDDCHAMKGRLEMVSQAAGDATEASTANEEAAAQGVSACVGRFSKKLLKALGGRSSSKTIGVSLLKPLQRGQERDDAHRPTPVQGVYKTNGVVVTIKPPSRNANLTEKASSGYSTPTRPSPGQSTPSKAQMAQESSSTPPLLRTLPVRNAIRSKTPPTKLSLLKVGPAIVTTPPRHQQSSMENTDSAIGTPELPLPISSNHSTASMSTRSGGSVSTCSPSSHASSSSSSRNRFSSSSSSLCERLSSSNSAPTLSMHRSISSLRHNCNDGCPTRTSSPTWLEAKKQKVSSAHKCASPTSRSGSPTGFEANSQDASNVSKSSKKTRSDSSPTTESAVPTVKIIAGQPKEKIPSEPLPLPASVERRRAELARQREREWWRRNSLQASGAGRVTPACRSSIRVFLRCKPLGVSSFDSPGSMVRAVRRIDTHCVEVQRPWQGAPPQRFAFDSVFGEEAAQNDVYASCRDIVQSVSHGARAAILAYGQTGSGKTHTVYGTEEDPGLAPRAALDLLKSAPGRLHVSMLELNFDGLVDLLAPQRPRGKVQSPPLEIRRGPGNLVVIDGLRDVPVESVSALGSVVTLGLSRRRRCAHLLNTDSSRGHLVLILRTSSGGQLMICDLAGTERVKRSGVQGSQMREAQGINRSLQCLSEVVDALRHGRSHVPYRNSTLTLLLSDALSGCAETAAVVCIASDACNVEESVSTLCFAQRVRLVRDQVPPGAQSMASSTSSRPSK